MSSLFVSIVPSPTTICTIFIYAILRKICSVIFLSLLLILLFQLNDVWLDFLSPMLYHFTFRIKIFFCIIVSLKINKIAFICFVWFVSHSIFKLNVQVGQFATLYCSSARWNITMMSVSYFICFNNREFWEWRLKILLINYYTPYLLNVYPKWALC